MNRIKIDNLIFSYQDNLIFNKLSFELLEGKNLSIVGASGSGKTTLLRLLSGGIKNYKGEIAVNGNFVLVEDNLEDVSDVNKYLNIKDDKLKEELNIYFALDKLLQKDYCDFSLEERYLLLVIKSIVSKPDIIALDNILIHLSLRYKVLIINYLNSNNITLINVTSNMEEVVYTDTMMILYNGISAIDGPVMDVLKNEKIIKRLGFSLPFMVDLSIQLELYDLIDKIYLNKEMLVKDLWK